MRTSFLVISSLALACLTGCGPQEQVRTSEFYLKPENTAEFNKALDLCRKSGLSNKEKCTPVWQAKFALERDEERAAFETMRMERAATRAKADEAAGEGGVSVVPQTPRPVSAPTEAPTRSRSGAESADAGVPQGRY